LQNYINKNIQRIRSIRCFLSIPILFFSSSFINCVSPQVISQNDFYLGLLDSDNKSKINHFEKALSSANEYVRKAAAEELALLMSQGNDLSSATVTHIHKELAEKQGVWAAVFNTLNNLNKEKALSFFLNNEQSGTSINDARQFLLGECEKQKIIFTESEMAAIEGRYSTARTRYNEAMIFFRTFQEDGNWPSQIPEIFINYPNLINDLGRTFQYTQSGNEGLILYTQWEENLLSENVIAPKILDDLRYRLIFYTARITSRMGQYPKAVLLYEKAFPLTTSDVQKDACIWYILDLSMGSANSFIDYLEKYINHWHKSSLFNDLLERFLQKLVSERAWRNVIRTFNAIKEKGDNEAKAAYSWIIARTFEEGYLNEENKRLASEAVNANKQSLQAADFSTFSHITYNASSKVSIPSLYYRSLSAAVLEMPFLDTYANPVYANNLSSLTTNDNEQQTEETQTSDALQFLLDFFNNDAKSYALPYIRALESELSPDELRAIAQVFFNEENYSQAMRIVSLYINKEGYKRERRDFELMFPRPFLELIETYAKEFKIAPSLLFALIRTESVFQPAIVSHAGAVGLTQLMKATAEEMANLIRRSGGPDYTTDLDRTNPELNVHIGAYYLNYLMNRLNNDILLSLMSYNAGITRIRRLYTAGRMPVDLFMHALSILETRDYGKRVTGVAALYQELYY